MTFSRPTQTNLSSRLSQALTPEQDRLLRVVAGEAARRNQPLYIVGGFVRDLLLGIPGLDFDLVVEGDAIRLARAVAAKQGGRVTAHTPFKTAQWFPPPADSLPAFVDLISARSESYSQPAALPTVKPGGLDDDLRRRDFSINTLAIRLDGGNFGELRDDLGGLKDLEAGIVRVLHPASFTDDPTRLFRLVRYEQRYGFQAAPGTLKLIPAALPLIGKLSAERVRHELDMILEEEKAASMLKRLGGLGVLRAVHPDLDWTEATRKRFEAGMAGSATLEHAPSRRMLGWALWLMDLPLPGLKSIEKRLHFEAGLRVALLAASTLLARADTLKGKKPSQCVLLLDEMPIRAVQAVFLALPDGPSRSALGDYLHTWRHVKPKTNGHTLQERGLEPGPEYRSILTRLRAAWLDGEVKSVAEEIRLLDGLTKKD
jgi:tRNA nucleotidyltransferase (CCA-adding enzyme)